MAGFAIATLAVDFGHAQIVKTQLQRCADVTARGSIETYLCKGLATAQTAAPTLASKNTVDSGSGIAPTISITWGYWNASTNAFVAGTGTPVACQVSTSRTAAAGNPVPLAFPILTSSSVSLPTCDISTTAVAVANSRLLFDYSSGFGGASPTPTPTLVGSSVISGTHLRITPAAGSKAGAAWSAGKVSVGCFTSAFSFQLTSAVADGFCYVMQNQSPTALGAVGIGIGYGGITKSLCVKFDLYNNSGEGTDSTGIFTGGATPTVPALDMTSSGVVIKNGHIFNVNISYDGTTLSWTVTDATTGSTYSASSVVNIPSVIGGSTAYVGFVGSTGGSYAQ
jgi:hypothetical protein